MHCEATAHHITRGVALSAEGSDWLLTFSDFLFQQLLLFPPEELLQMNLKEVYYHFYIFLVPPPGFSSNKTVFV